MGEFLLYPIIFAAVGWTSRLAKSKGKNPWLWGGASVLLSLLHVPQTAILSLIPALVLLFVKFSITVATEQEDRQACARCAKPHSDGQHFCTGCGWDLNETYSEDVAESEQPLSERPPVQPTISSTGGTQAPVVTKTPKVESTVGKIPTEDSNVEIAAEVPIENLPAVVEVKIPTAEQPPAEKSNETEQAVETNIEATEDQADPEYVPWGTYDPGLAPTAAVMVARGIERFAEEKYQEAIDQFTKAIALDPNYAEAWERRAESYSQMGRSERAEDDRRHLKGLNPSSSPS